MKAFFITAIVLIIGIAISWLLWFVIGGPFWTDIYKLWIGLDGVYMLLYAIVGHGSNILKTE